MDKIKIAIITIYQNVNYGSLLQNYALQKIINNYNYYCMTIKFSPNSTTNKNRHLFKRIFNLLIHPMAILEKLFILKNAQKKEKFCNFINSYINETNDEYKDNEALKSVCDKFDAFISGSDQIWSPVQFNKGFFLDFCRDNKKKYLMLQV